MWDAFVIFLMRKVRLRKEQRMERKQQKQICNKKKRMRYKKIDDNDERCRRETRVFDPDTNPYR